MPPRTQTSFRRIVLDGDAPLRWNPREYHIHGGSIGEGRRRQVQEYLHIAYFIYYTSLFRQAAAKENNKSQKQKKTKK